MQVKTVQIHWHEKQPIFAADFDPTCPSRLATAGGDNNVRVWKVVEMTTENGACEASVQYAATLSRHIKPVNCVRFSPNGQYLASASDGGTVVLWKPSSGSSSAIFGEDEDDPQSEAKQECTEYWKAVQMFRASDLEDIYDLAWSPDSRFVLFGLTDHSVQIWDVTSGQKVKVIKEHGHFVQGTAWDPLNVFVTTQSSDRTVRNFKIAARLNGSIHVASFGKFARAPLSLFNTPSTRSTYSDNEAEKQHSMFLDETLLSFFRRPAFSPDGALLFMPAGIVPNKSANEDETEEGDSAVGGRHAFYIATRGQLSSLPGIVVDGFKKGVVAIRPHPRLFRLSPDQAADKAPLFKLPYRIVYAVASQDSVAIFDTNQLHPIATFSSLHYGTLTDLAWSANGKYLLATATDGFATLISIPESGLGEMLGEAEQAELFEGIRQKYAPDAIPKPKILDPLQLDMSLSSEPVAPTSEVDRITSENDVPLINVNITCDTSANEPPPSPHRINILPVKRKIIQPSALNISTTESFNPANNE